MHTMSVTDRFPYYIEDWILWLGRCYDNYGNEIDFPYYRSWPIKLANYDITFISRSCTEIKKGIGFTDRQIGMAVKIITKYKRQILKKIKCNPEYLLDHAPNRLAIRSVDRSYTVVSSNNGYLIKFPYQPSLVEKMHKLSAQRAGDFYWDKNRRQWYVDKTEKNLVLLQQFITSHANHAWSLDNEFQKHCAEITSILSTHPSVYLPCLELGHDGQLTVLNQTPGLAAALVNFNFNDDFANAVFCASNYGMYIGPNLEKQVRMQYPNIADILLCSQAEIYNNSQTLNSHLSIQHVNELTQTLKADYWIFLKVKPPQSREQKSTLNTYDFVQPKFGKKLLYSQGFSNLADYTIKKIQDLNTNKIIILSDNSMIVNRMMHRLPTTNILRMIYSHQKG